MFTYRIRSQVPNMDAFLKLNNLLDEDIRLHTSVLKDISPMGGRSAMLGMRIGF